MLVQQLKEHSRLSAEDISVIEKMRYTLRKMEANEDLIRQGDNPSASAVVLSGLVARYHLLDNGARQYLSFHMTGDMPDSQSLFIERMDHAACAIGPASVAMVPHKELLAAFKARSSIGFAIWRETLIDAAIFRQAITNNSARSMTERMAHLFCELFYRARASGLVNKDLFELPISRVQLGETLGMAIATVNRTLEEIHASHAASFNRSQLHVKNWKRLVDLARFDPGYLHQKRPPLL